MGMILTLIMTQSSNWSSNTVFAVMTKIHIRVADSSHLNAVDSLFGNFMYVNQTIHLFLLEVHFISVNIRKDLIHQYASLHV